MKLLPRRGERRALGATAGRAGPSVADMFDSLITWFTPQRRARIAFPLEIVLGAWLALAVLLNQQWWGGFVHTALNVGVALAVGVGVALHRARPAWALIALLITAFGLLLTFAFGTSLNPLVFVGGAVIVFGAAAYGATAARRASFAISAVTAITVIVAVALGVGDPGRVYPTVFIAHLLSYSIWPVLALLPWVLGELVRSIRNRRALSATVATVSTQRDAALTRADLEAERTRVARDVHDVVAHSLTVVIAQADGARYATAQRDEQAADAFETIAQTARDALADVRVLLTGLRHTQEDGPQPGLGDLDGLLDSMRDAGLTLAVREFGKRGHLTETRALALYRILQEALTNALRHGARDEPTVVELEWGADAVDLVVTNAAPASAAAEHAESAEPPHPGHGIDGMRERATLAGGVLSVHEGETFRVRLRLPVEPSPEPAEPGEDARSADVSESPEVNA
ncbi:MAG: sensor histidine kinase [Leifsonia sp.]|nr:sensor histidine kinase [Leifsonia sp.]